MSNERLILQDFMEAFLNRAGALVERPGYGMLEAVLPDDLALHFGKSHFLLAFDYEVAGENQDSAFVTHGSNLLDITAGLTLEYGRFTRLFRPDTGVTPPRNLERQIMEGLKFLNCRPPRTIHQWMVDQVFYEFNFRCTFRSYEKTEVMFPVVVDSHSGLPEHGFAGLWKNVAPLDRSEYRLPRADEMPLPELYRKACREAGQTVQKLAEPVRRASSALMERELAKIKNYYDQTTREIENKRTNTDDAVKIARLEKQLAATVSDRRRREEDIAARYAVEADVRLDHLVAYHLPCVHIKLEVQHKDRAYNQIVVYNPYSHKIKEVACPECGEPTRVLVPGKNGLVCENEK